MRRATFRKAIKSVREALRFQADLHLAAASAAPAQALNQSLAGSGTDIPKLASQREQIQHLTTLLRLPHLRERFSRDYETPEPDLRALAADRSARPKLIEYIRRMDNPRATLGWLLGHLQREEAADRSPTRSSAALPQAA
jgi:hypothetical protein